MFAKYEDLAGKTILVTGASSGIGRAIALALGSQGANLFLSGRDLDALNKTAESAGAWAKVIPGDLSVIDDIEEIVAALPELDGICHSAGIVNPFPVRFIQKENIADVFDVNYRGPALLTSCIIRNKKIKSNSSIVFISSIAAKFSYQGGSAYSGSKAALEAFSRNIAIEHSHSGIRSNCISAGMVKTRIYERSRNLISPDRMEQHRNQYPLGFGEVDDVASGCLFLLSDASRWITGTSLVMDGGLTAGQ